MAGRHQVRTTVRIPDWLVRVSSWHDGAVRQIVPELGKRKNATNEKPQRMLGWSPRANEEAIVATAQSLVRLGLLEGGQKRAT